jgi:hypothetical protein
MAFFVDGKETMTTDRATDRCGPHIGFWMYNRHPTTYDNVLVGGRLDREWLKEALAALAGADAGPDASSYSAAWARKDPKGDAPGTKGRFTRSGVGPGAMYDSKRKLCIMYGGAAHGQARMNDLWAYDAAKNRWTCLEPHDETADDRKRPKGWGGSSGAPIVYDPATDLYWLASGGTNDKSNWWWLWTYDPEKKAYSKVMKIQGADLRFQEGGLGDCVLGYSPRLRALVSPWEVIDTRTRKKKRIEPLMKTHLKYSSFSYMSANGLGTAGADGTFIVFGAPGSREEAKPPAETWRLDPNRRTWTKLQLEKSPPVKPRRNLVYHRKLNVWVLFGGGAPGSRANDLWVYSPRKNTWMPVRSKGPRGWGAMWYDEAHDDVVFFSQEHGAIHTLELTPRK